MRKKQWMAMLFSAAGWVVTPAQAGLTPIQSPPPGEKNQAQILSEFYGGKFMSSGNDFTNGSLRAVRLISDSTFAAGDYAVKTIARFAERAEGFGFVDGTSGGSYHKLFEVSGSNFGATGSANVNTGSGSFRWAMNGKSAIYTSKESDNAKKQDALVTYRIDGTADRLTHYALFWENLNADEPANVHTRNDFNDLVVDVTKKTSTSIGNGLGAGVTGPSGGTNAAPLPAAVWPGGAMLAGILLYRARRKLRVALV